MTVRNNVTRLLESKGVSFQVHELPNEKVSAVDAAAILGYIPGIGV